MCRDSDIPVVMRADPIDLHKANSSSGAKIWTDGVDSTNAVLPHSTDAS